MPWYIENVVCFFKDVAAMPLRDVKMYLVIEYELWRTRIVTHSSFVVLVSKNI